MALRRGTLWQAHIGDANGLIALWLDEAGAKDLRDLLMPEDRLRAELDEALEKAYPEGIPRCAEEGCDERMSKRGSTYRKWCPAHCPHPREDIIDIPTGDTMCGACGRMW